MSHKRTPTLLWMSRTRNFGNGAIPFYTMRTSCWKPYALICSSNSRTGYCMSSSVISASTITNMSAIRHGPSSTTQCTRFSVSNSLLVLSPLPHFMLLSATVISHLKTMNLVDRGGSRSMLTWWIFVARAAGWQTCMKAMHNTTSTASTTRVSHPRLAKAVRKLEFRVPADRSTHLTRHQESARGSRKMVPIIITIHHKVLRLRNQAKHLRTGDTHQNVHE